METSNALFVTVLTRAAPLIIWFVVVALIEKLERRTMIIQCTIVRDRRRAHHRRMRRRHGDGRIAPGRLAFPMATPAYTYTAEVFPTTARGTAASVCDGLGHLGGAVAPFVILPTMINVGAVAAGITMIVLLIVAAILIRLGMRTKDRSLLEINN